MKPDDDGPDGHIPGQHVPGELVPDAWRDADDTLAELGVERVPAGSERWLAQQRFVHGLLRALHTADASARETRIQNLFESLDGESVRSAREPGRARARHWALVAAAALLLTALGVFAVLPERLPTADAAVARAVAHLGRDADLRYRLTMRGTDAEGRQRVRQDFDVVVRPGGRFLVDGKLTFGTVSLGEFRIGSDGEELWAMAVNGPLRRAVPLAERERLLAGMGEVFDLGYLDVQQLVRRLPDDFELRATGRQTDASGRSLVRVEATRPRRGGQPVLRSAWLLCDEASGMVTQLFVESEFGRGARRELAFELVGEAPAGSVDYRKPW